jgi:hypothetical protein
LPRDVGVVVVAAGQGSRLGGEVPKQFLPVAGVPVLLRALRPFASHPDVEYVEAVRAELGPKAPLMADANNAYSLEHVEPLIRLDQLDLIMIEQPLAWDDLRQHAVEVAVLHAELSWISVFFIRLAGCPINDRVRSVRASVYLSATSTS